MTKGSSKSTLDVQQNNKDKASKKRSTKIRKIRTDQLRNMVQKRWKSHTDEKRIDLKSSKMISEIQGKVLAQLNEDNIYCPICLDYTLYPILTECGHHFCLQCFEKAQRVSQNCCVCRAKINFQDYEVNNFLKNLFQDYIKRNKDWAEAEIYWNRKRDLLNKEQRRCLGDIVRIGQMVDYRLNRIWVEARVVKVEDRSIDIIVVDQDPKEQTTITMSKNSRCLARHRSFTYDPRINEEKNTSPSIFSIIVRPFRRRVVQRGENGIQSRINQRDDQPVSRERRNTWEQDLISQENNNTNWWIVQQTPILNSEGLNMWEPRLEDDDRREENFFQLVL